MKIAIASDHGGYNLKNQLIDYFSFRGIEFLKVGPDCTESCDYPDAAKPLAEAILAKKADLGIGICGAGIGMSIALNRFHGIRAALLYNDYAAEMAKKHNDANILVFGGRTMELEDVVRRIEIFMTTEFEGGRHVRRIEKIEQGEE